MIIHRYITCEGHFSLVHLYHIRLLIHVNGDYPLNLPYFLLKILSKMSKRIQTHPATTKKSIFHQGLIKTLVIYALSEVQRSWDWLIQSLKPKQQEPKSKTAKEKKPGKGKNISQIIDACVKESSPAARVTRSSKRKLQTQHGIEDFPRGRPNEKITKGRSKKLKLGKELDVQTDPDIKDEPEL
jgi:hypothetical protein